MRQENNKIIALMHQSIEESKKSKSEDQGVHPYVGAILADGEGNIIQRAHRGEVPGCHAEYLCINKAKEAGQELLDCCLFVTLEPCTARGPGKTACCTHIIKSGIKKVYIGMLDPNPAICGRGETRLRFYLQVERYPSDLIREIEKINSEFIEKHKSAHLSEESLYVKMQINQIMQEYLIRRGVPLIEELPMDVDLDFEDIIRICEAACISASKSSLNFKDLVLEARSEAFDKKYSERTYDDDGRGLGNYWADAIKRILIDMDASN
jgi:pyrimidine deaminase RibD-like protein